MKSKFFQNVWFKKNKNNLKKKWNNLKKKLLRSNKDMKFLKDRNFNLNVRI